MNILLIADPTGLGDEGARNISKDILSVLKKEHNVLCVPAKIIPLSLLKIFLFKPDIIHSIHGPSKTTFYLMRVLKKVCSQAKFYMSMTHPNRAQLYSSKLSWKKYNFITLLTQDEDVEFLMRGNGFSCIPFPNGINIERFTPIPKQLPDELVELLPVDKKLLLHVGHIKKSRGLDIMAVINKATEWHSVIIGSTRFPAEEECHKMLIDAGCTVYQGYIENLAGLYSSVDAYIFPVSDINGSIDMPLTVLESLSCGCPVLSTPFKALPRFLPADSCIYYYKSESEAIITLQNLLQINPDELHEKMKRFSWSSLIDELVKIYQLQ